MYIIMKSYDLGQLQSGQNPVVLDPTKKRPQTKSQQPPFYFGSATPSYLVGNPYTQRDSIISKFSFGGC